MSTTAAYREKFSAQPIGPNNVRMIMIGGWGDLCAYYAGSDGNAWSSGMSWSNKGPVSEFIKQLKNGKYRGEFNPV